MNISVQNGGIIETVGAERCYQLIAQAGFTGIDWNLDHALPGTVIKSLDYKGKCVFEQSLDKIIEHYADELALIRKNGLTLSQAHSPFPAYIPGHPEVLEYMIGIYNRMIEFCDYVGCPYLVIHGISLPLSEKEDTHETVETLNWHLYESLIPTLQKCNVTVCLENLFTWDTAAVEGVCSDPHEAVRYIDTLNEKAGREVFGLCLDTGHLQLLGKDFRSYIAILGKRIKALHLHDNDGRVDRHLAPMTGKVKWTHLCDSLRAVGYSGDLSFETFQQALAAYRFDEEMLLPWLTLICKTGECFRKHIQQ